MRPDRARSALRNLLVLLPLAVCGCGLLFTHGPPPDHEQLKSFTCTASNTGPAIDLAWGLLNLGGALIIAGNPDQYKDSQQEIASGIGWGVVSVISAAVGFDKVHRCVAAMKLLSARTAAQESTYAAQRAQILATTPADIQSVVITPAADTLHSGEQVQLSVQAFASSGSYVAGRPYSWSSSNDAIASVSNAGLVTAHAPGAATIAANTNNVVGTSRIEVIAAP